MFGLPSLSALQLGAIVAGVAFAAGNITGWKIRDLYADQEELALVKNSQEVQRLKQKAIDRAAENYERSREQIEKESRDAAPRIEKIATRIEYRDICLDVDGMRELEQAIRGPAASAFSQPAKSVP